MKFHNFKVIAKDSFKLKTAVDKVVEWCQKHSEPLWIVNWKEKSSSVYWGYILTKDGLQTAFWHQIPCHKHAHIINCIGSPFSITKDLEIRVNPNDVFLKYFSK